MSKLAQHASEKRIRAEHTAPFCRRCGRRVDLGNFRQDAHGRVFHAHCMTIRRTA